MKVKQHVFVFMSKTRSLLWGLFCTGPTHQFPVGGLGGGGDLTLHTVLLQDPLALCGTERWVSPHPWGFRIKRLWSQINLVSNFSSTTSYLHLWRITWLLRQFCPCKMGTVTRNECDTMCKVFSTVSGNFYCGCCHFCCFQDVEKGNIQQFQLRQLPSAAWWRETCTYRHPFKLRVRASVLLSLRWRRCPFCALPFLVLPWGPRAWPI